MVPDGRQEVQLEEYLMDVMSFLFGLLLGFFAAAAVVFDRLLARDEKRYLHLSSDTEGFVVFRVSKKEGDDL
jgi:hypothetical protein